MSSSDSIKQNSPKKPLFTRFLDTVEYLGNLLPHPITLFAIFCLAILVMSGIAGYFEVSVVDPRPEGAKGRAADGMIHVVSLLNADGLELIVTNLVKNFVGFAPLGTVLVAMLGVAIAEYSGLLSAAMRGLVMGASQRMVTVTVVFAGIISNTASELGCGTYSTGCNAVPFFRSSPTCRSCCGVRWCIWWLLSKPTYWYG